MTAGPPATVGLREVLHEFLHVNRTGIPWKYFLHGFPERPTATPADADLLRPTGASPSQAPVGSGTRAATASLVRTRKVRVSSKYRVTLVASWER
ncbi:hypothetical protein GCM10022206_23480 [Streptomyces chiangmaiensis]